MLRLITFFLAMMAGVCTMSAQQYKGKPGYFVARTSIDGGGSYSEISTANNLVLDLSSENTSYQLIDEDGNVALYMPLVKDSVLSIDFIKKSDAEATSTQKITITDAGYATYCSEFQLDMSKVNGRFKVYVPTFDESTNQIILNGSTRVDNRNIVLPVRTPIIVKGPAGTYDLGMSSKVQSAASISGQAFGGTIYDTQTGLLDNGSSLYTLSIEDGVVGFYPYKPSVLAAHKAYLLLSPSEAKAITFALDDDVTSVQSVCTEAETSGPTYNTIGQRVDSKAHGIVITNGKKFVNK